MGLFNGKFKWLTGEIEIPSDVDPHEEKQRKNNFKSTMNKGLQGNTFISNDYDEEPISGTRRTNKIFSFFNFSNTDGQNDRN